MSSVKYLAQAHLSSNKNNRMDTARKGNKKWRTMRHFL
ncbi:hypothetical protein N474_02870 [Pseudoalteromonas luteoviolacea CPMOR-2]|nr:hypothetical protein N474_02870 [Pseudoalteromonas luteoviolacea CPMOR-2]